MKGICVAVLVVALGGGMAGSARGDMVTVPLAVDGAWQVFYWHSAPGAWNDSSFTSPYEPVTFTYSSARWTSLHVTDFRVAGDQFNVYDAAGLHLIGTTSSVPQLPWAYTGDIDYACSNSRWSSGAFLLPPGDHSIRFETIATAPLMVPPGSPYNVNGHGALRIETTVVPLPAAATLALLGLSVGGWFLRRWSA